MQLDLLPDAPRAHGRQYIGNPLKIGDGIEIHCYDGRKRWLRVAGIDQGKPILSMVDERVVPGCITYNPILNRWVERRDD